MNAPDDEPWWCWECHGMGSWEETMEESDDPGEVECPCCNGDGSHQGDTAPACAPQPGKRGDTPGTER